jgi:hypothetical protein
MSQSRCFLYSSDCPGGKIFEGDDAIAAAKKSGWKDSPAKAVKKAAAKKKASGGAKKKASKGDNST